ncbi:unnamed protein product [Durusdinium trenchii]|uniref:Uncharacterized protein n=2 Tax=Durusdinium trenchii TaxID=1381693 RepID=A0ABP0NV84_9DINO
MLFPWTPKDTRRKHAEPSLKPTCRYLQAHAKQAERDLAREREKLWKEVEAERTSLHAEFDVERAAMRKERRRLAENADRQRREGLPTQFWPILLAVSS